MKNNQITLTVFSKEENVTYYITIPVPHPDEVTKYSDIFNDKSDIKKYHQHYYEQDLKGKSDNTIKEEILREYFQDKNSPKGFTPNKELRDILIKVTLLNDYYNTRIDSNMLVPLARQIFALDIDEKLMDNGNANCDLVNAIAYYRGSVNKDGDKVNFAYSFASKYCSWHCPQLYPILDSYVKGLLYYINESYLEDEDKFIIYPDDIFNSRSKDITVKNKYLNDYENYYSAYMKFVKKYKLDTNIENRYKKIDEYLWMLTQDELTNDNCMVEVEIKQNNGKKHKEIIKYNDYKKQIDEYNRIKKAEDKKHKDKRIAKKISHLIKLDGDYNGMNSRLEKKDSFRAICNECISIS